MTIYELENHIHFGNDQDINLCTKIYEEYGYGFDVDLLLVPKVFTLA